MKTGLQGDFALWNLWELWDSTGSTDFCSTPTGDTVTTRATHISISVHRQKDAKRRSHGNCLLTDMSRPSPHGQHTGRSDIEITKAAMRLCDKPRKTGSKTRSFNSHFDRLVAHNSRLRAALPSGIRDSPRALIQFHAMKSAALDRMNHSVASPYFESASLAEPASQGTF